MKKINLLTCIISFILSSCSSFSNKDLLSKDFTITSTEEGFKTQGSNNIYYYYKGQLSNNTQNIYKKVYVKMNLVLELENGQQITDESINDGPFDFFAGLGSFHSLEMVEPGKKYEMRDFESAPIDKAYSNYPVKTAILQFTVKTRNEINQEESEYVLVKSDDVTAKWKAAMSNANPESDGYEAIGGGSYMKVHPTE